MFLAFILGEATVGGSWIIVYWHFEALQGTEVSIM